MNTFPFPQRILRAPLVMALVLLAGCAATDDDRSRDVTWLVQHGREHEAVKVAAEQQAARPDDPAAAEKWRLASVALLLSQCRQLSFEGRDVEALEKVDAALALAPEIPQVRHWHEALLDKLAEQWVVKASEWHASDNLVEANTCYEKSLEYRPDDVRAKEGLSRVLLQLNYRRGMGEKYYQSGIEALAEYWLEQAAHDLSATHRKYDPLNERAKRRGAETETMRADNRVLIAEGFEDEGAFSAARNEYRMATLLDPKHEAALAGLERTRKEEQAAESLREAERRILRREFAEAEQAIADGLALTQRQHEAFDRQRDQLVIAKLTVRYDAARALESDHRYEEAISAYGGLLETAPQGFFLDAIARRDTLQDFVSKAESLYNLAVAASDPADQLRLLNQILVVYPEYKDVQQRIAALQAAPPQPPTEKSPR